MADLNGHAAGNGGHSQGTPTAHRALLYSDFSDSRCLPGTLTPWAERLTNFVLEFTNMTLNLEVHLPSCLIEDGNYADICVGGVNMPLSFGLHHR
jgi:hypothetical protein